MTRFQKTLLTIACLVLAFSQKPAYATFISPSRIVINDGETAKAITIFNRTREPLIYTFLWERRYMNETGETIKLTEGEIAPTYLPADDFTIFSPRQVIINPGEHQRVRILARRPADLPNGEYHSHLLVRPRSVKNNKDETNYNSGFGGTIKIEANLSLPVFVRKGQTEFTAEVENIHFVQENNKEVVKLNINNNGSTEHAYLRHELICTIDGEEKISHLLTKRIYTEAVKIPVSQELPDDYPSTSSCQSLVLKLSRTLNGRKHIPYKEIKLR